VQVLGLPLGEWSATPVRPVFQPFEQGSMLWFPLPAGPHIFVLYREGTWAIYPDTFSDAEAGTPEAAPQPPAGLYAPVRGFGHLWLTHPEVRNKLGWAGEPEKLLQGGHWERFENGWLLNIYDVRLDQVYALFSPQPLPGNGYAIPPLPLPRWFFARQP
jgi:hypothetical protein